MNELLESIKTLTNCVGLFHGVKDAELQKVVTEKLLNLVKKI